MNLYARIPVCGLVANYNLTAPPKARTGGSVDGHVLTKSLTVRGFIQTEFASSHGRDFVRDMPGGSRDGLVRYREDVVDGLDRPSLPWTAHGANFGKLLVRVSPDPTL